MFFFSFLHDVAYGFQSSKRFNLKIFTIFLHVHEIFEYRGKATLISTIYKTKNFTFQNNHRMQNNRSFRLRPVTSWITNTFRISTLKMITNFL